MKDSTSPATTAAFATDSGSARSKLASVLALSSTALSGAFMANAQVIYTSGTLDVTVGFGGATCRPTRLIFPG